ncbi:glycerol-3-phosphate acyltransferase 1, mitochondrial-like [Styela clava]
MQRQHVEDRPVMDLLTMFDQKDKKGFLTRTCYYCFIAMENKTEADYPTLESLHNKVLNNEKVKKVVETTKNYSESHQRETRIQAMSIAKHMIGTVTSRVIRFCGWIYLVLLKQVCGSVQFSSAQMQTIQEVSCGNIPIIYMPLHFSHLDYILVSLVLFHNNIRTPFIASGDNLNLPVVGYFIKRSGGFFIRRKLDESNRKDILYRSILQTYMTEILKTGQSVEIFLEGTRSRSGLPNVPKSGLLSVLVDAVVEGEVPDALLVPVSLSYEKLLEGNFNNEHIGKSKKPESLWSTFKSVAGMLTGYYGNIKVDFAKPISLKSALRDICMYSSSKNLVADEYSCQLSIGESRNGAGVMSLTESFIHQQSYRQDTLWRKNISFLAEHIIFNGLSSRSFMSTHLVAFLLINRWRNGVSMSDLTVSFTRLKAEIIASGRNVAFSGSAQDVVLNAINLLGKKVIFLDCVLSCKEADSLPSSPVGYNCSSDVTIPLLHDELEKTDESCDDNTDSGIFVRCDSANSQNSISDGESSPKKEQKSSLFIKPILSVPEIFELTYYSNLMTPLYALESIICLSIGAVTGCRFSMVEKLWEMNGGADIFEDSLPEKMILSFLRSNLLEKALELCDFLQLDLILCDVVVDLEDCLKDTIHNLVSSGCLISETIGNARITHAAYGLDEDENCSNDQWLKVNPLSISQLLCYQNILAAIVEGSAMVTEKLNLLHNPISRKEFLSILLEFSQSRSRNGLTSRVESCSSEILSHCIYAFKCNKVIKSKDGMLSLTEECQSSDHLDNLLSKICQFMV